MNKQLLAQIINDIKMNQQQGAFGNVTDNEMSMFSGNPASYTNRINAMRNANNAAGAVGNVSNREASLFNMMAGNGMNGANLGMQQSAMAQAVNEMRALQAKGASGNGVLTQDEINRFIYLRNMLNPNLPQEEPVGMPIDIDGASAGNAMSTEELNELLQKLQRMR